MQGQLPGVQLLLANGALSKKASAQGQPLLDLLNQLAVNEPGRDYVGVVRVLQLPMPAEK